MTLLGNSFYLDSQIFTVSVLESVFERAFVDGVRAIPKNPGTVRLVLTELSFKVGAIPIKYLTFPLFQAILVNPNKTIPIAVNNFRLAVQ